jgi:hypothetical protein
MLLGRRERKGLCRPRACPENPLELVLVCLNNSTGFFAQTVARFEGECQGTATPCRETPVCRTLKKLGDVRSLQGRYDSASDGLLGSLVIADVPISCFVRHFAVSLFQEVLYVINDASDSPFGSPH